MMTRAILSSPNGSTEMDAALALAIAKAYRTDSQIMRPNIPHSPLRGILSKIALVGRVGP